MSYGRLHLHAPGVSLLIGHGRGLLSDRTPDRENNSIVAYTLSLPYLSLTPLPLPPPLPSIRLASLLG